MYLDETIRGKARISKRMPGISPTEEIIEEARAGRMFLLIDDEDRENEGDLVVPAQFAGPEQINFMARHGRGLICLALTQQRTEWLGLQPMSAANGSRHSTAFMVSIEARTGIDTGISAHDRARTIQVAIAAESTAYDLVSPGHVFPLAAREGGTLVRAGHTEAAVDVSRLAGLDPSGVICEVMKDDGTMARLPDLLDFAERHDLRIGTIADLIAYRQRRERLVDRLRSGTVTDGAGREWSLQVFRDQVNGVDHLALTKGDLTTDAPVLVRVQVEDVVGQMLNTAPSSVLARAMGAVHEAGRGAVLLIRGARPFLPDADPEDPDDGTPILKDFGIGAQMLVELGIHEIELLETAQRSIVALDGFGLKIVGRRSIG